MARNPQFSGEELLQLMMECVEDYKLNKSPNDSMKNLKNLLLRFHRWLDSREMTVKECRAYVKYMQTRMKDKSTSSEVGRIKSFLKWLHYEKELTGHDWSRDIRRPKIRETREDAPEQLLSPEKLKELIIQVTTPKTIRTGKLGERDAYINNEYRNFLLFMSKMGLRPGEALNIDPKKVSLYGSPPSVMVFRSKLNRWQNLGLPLDFLDPIKECVNRGKWFDVCRTGWQEKMKQISALAGKKVVLYSIRKSVDTGILDNGAPIMHAAEHQGHTVGVMQSNYIKFSAKQSSYVNNTYNPHIDKTKIPVSYTLPEIERLHTEWAMHPDITKEYQEILLADGSRELVWVTRAKVPANC